MLQHAVDVAHYVGVRHPHKAETLARKPFRAAFIIVLLLGMAFPVHFDDELRFSANEVGNEWAKPNLTAEFQTAKLPRTEARPKLALGRRRVATGIADASEGVRTIGLRTPHPSPSRAFGAGPFLSPSGRGKSSRCLK